MNIEYLPNYEALSQSGANVVKACIEKSPKGLFCLATGSSPKGLYQYLSQDPTFDGQGIKVLALDEWLGLEQTPQAHVIIIWTRMCLHLGASARTINLPSMPKPKPPKLNVCA